MKPDKRYTTAKEFMGWPRAAWVARFCGIYIGPYATKRDAQKACEEHNEFRFERG